MTTEQIPVAVIGAGNMGVNHVRVYDELPGANLVEVVEPDPKRAGRIATEYDVVIRDHPDELELARAATVAVPNQQHRRVAETCLENGLDVLVEKPIATNVDDAESIVAKADDTDAVLQVGHIEQFNPAIDTLRKLLDRQEVISFEAHRLGPFNDHLSEESVIIDLMIHDLDIIDSFVDSSISHLNALGSTPRSEKIDYSVAQFKFENGVVGAATASHVTNGKVRKLNVTTQEAYIMLDYQEQDVVIQRRGTEQTTTLLNQSGYRTETITESPYVRNREPLKNELEHFLECVRERREPMVSGADGVRAVKLATDVLRDIK